MTLYTARIMYKPLRTGMVTASANRMAHDMETNFSASCVYGQVRAWRRCPAHSPKVINTMQ